MIVMGESVNRPMGESIDRLVAVWVDGSSAPGLEPLLPKVGQGEGRCEMWADGRIILGCLTVIRMGLVGD